MAPCQSRKQVIDGFSGLSMSIFNALMSGCARRGGNNEESEGAKWGTTAIHFWRSRWILGTSERAKIELVSIPRERDSCMSCAAVVIYEAMSGPREGMSRGFKWNQLERLRTDTAIGLYIPPLPPPPLPANYGSNSVFLNTWTLVILVA